MQNLITATGKRPTVSSVVIAEQYGRRHQTVLDSISGLIESGHIGEQEILLTSYTDKSNRQSRCYELAEEDGMRSEMDYKAIYVLARAGVQVDKPNPDEETRGGVT